MADENSYSQPKGTSNAHGKIYEVIKSSKKDFDGVIGQGKERMFGKSGGFTTRDPKLAKELSDKYGYAKGGSRDVIVVERDEYAASSRKNLHTVPAMPWKEEE
jgi:hypothetical protein